jgi:hypothetical protein
MMPIIADPIIVKPGKPVSLDVTSALNTLVRCNGALTFSIQLVLSPEPPTQPQPDHYAVRFVNGECEYFGRPLPSDSS